MGFLFRTEIRFSDQVQLVDGEGFCGPQEKDLISGEGWSSCVTSWGYAMRMQRGSLVRVLVRQAAVTRFRSETRISTRDLECVQVGKEGLRRAPLGDRPGRDSS